MTSGDHLSRRSFLAGISAAWRGAHARPWRSLSIRRVPPRKRPKVTAWLLIGSDNSVVIRVARAEMGQGATTGLAMLVAEELECDWTKVRTEFVSAGREFAPPSHLGRHVDRRKPFDRSSQLYSAASRRHRA
jgi:isoquinoline 1-oxidoreductase beta subunit